jgi:anti-anti-sigma factor
MADEIYTSRPKGRLDSSACPAFEAEVVSCLNAGNQRVLFDFSDLDYISSAGLRVVLMAAKRLKETGGRMVLCSLNDMIKEVFEVSGFDRILDIEPDAESARTRLAAS